MAEAEDYFAYLYSNWRKEHSENPDQSPRTTQEKLWLEWAQEDQGPGVQKRRDPEQERRDPERKRIRDPEAPKRPMSAYLVFCGGQRKELASSGQYSNQTEVAKEMGRRWRELGDGEKAIYTEQASKLREKYDEQVKKKKQKLTSAVVVPKRKPDNLID
jgi:hypothetical protein